MTTGAKSNPWTSEMPELRGPWLGQGSPRSDLTAFCPEILGTEQRVAGITFSPEGDEAFFSLDTPDGASAALMWTRIVDGRWTTPEPAPFNSAQIDNDICMSPDGQRLCWRSWRPLPGNTVPEETVSLWATDRTSDGWSDPFPVECGGERQAAVYPGIAASGTLYFSVRTPQGERCIVRAKRSGNQYEAPEPIITGAMSTDLCVSPDESFLVVTIFPPPPTKGQGNLCVSYQDSDETWTPLRDLGPEVKSDLTEYCPTISADGKKLFFCRRIDREDRSVRARVYWIDTGFIEALRPTG